MSWNIKTPGDYINGPLTVAGTATVSGNVGIGTTSFTSISGYTTLKINNAANGSIIDLAKADAYVGRLVANSSGFSLESAGTNPINLQVGGLNSFSLFPSGVFTWYDGAGGTRMTLNSTGLGVGTAPSFKLSVTGVSQFYANADGIYASGDASPDLFVIGVNYWNNAGTEGVKVSARPSWKIEHKNSTDALAYFDIGFRAANAAAGTFTSRFKIDGSGNVGVGVTPSAWASVALQVGPYAGLHQNNTLGSAELTHNCYRSAGSTWNYIQTDTAARYRMWNSAHTWWIAPSGTAGNAITFTQAMTLDASGKLILGTTSPYNAARLTVQSAGGAGGIATAIQNDNDSYYAINFRNSSGTSCGSISCLTSSTAFNTSSDYRLKESVQPLTDGLARINALKPSIYKWKVDGKNGEGFLAHELADVVPLAVTGEKDAVNEDGSIKPQAVDLSKIVPILVAAIKELTARVEALEA
jgi:hypothetical protein